MSRRSALRVLGTHTCAVTVTFILLYFYFLYFALYLQVEVPPHKTAYAALVVHEENFDAELLVRLSNFI